MKTNTLFSFLIASFVAFGFVWYSSSFSNGLMATNAGFKVEHNEDTLRLSPTVLVNSEKGMKSLVINSCVMNVTSNGALAETSMELTFQNFDDRIYEGTFYFPLYEGQIITKLELEQNGKYREGSVVKKDVGRIAFEATERKQIDPALLEWSAGNSFKLRVYPIPAKGTKKIRITYVEALKQNESGLFLAVPLHFKDRMKNFELTVDFPSDVVLTGNTNFQKVPTETPTWRYQTKGKDVFANQPIYIDVPSKLKEQAVVSTVNNTNYVLTHLQLTKSEIPKTLPKELTVLWDVSSSTMNRDFEKERIVFTEYLRKIGTAKLHIVGFSNDIQFKQDMELTPNFDVNALFTQLQKSAFDGATQLGCIQAGDLLGEEVLVFSDVLSNFGEKNWVATTSKRIIVINSAPQYDRSMAQRMSMKSGDYCSLIEMTPQQVSERLLSEPLRLLHVKGIPDSLVTGIGLPVQQYFTNALQLPTNVSTLEYQFGTGNRIVETVNVTVEAAKSSAQSDEMQRYFVAMKLQDLDINYPENERQMTELALSHRLISRFTSLLVLDGVEDYVKYDVPPPAELKNEFDKMKASAAKTEKEEINSHAKTVENRWKEITEWYDKTYERKKVTPNGTYSVNDSISVGEGYGNGAGAGSPRPSGSVQEMRVNSSALTYSFSANATMNDMATESEKDKEAGTSSASIQLAAWNPETPYLKALKAVCASQAYEEYLGLKKQYAAQPSFYIDVADYFIELKQPKIALRILSNLAEMELENPQLLRVLAHKLDQMNELNLSVAVFKEVKNLRPEEPQSYRDLALVYEKQQRYNDALNELMFIVNNKWDARFRDIEVIALVEANHICKRHPEANKNLILTSYQKAMPVDTRVILTWDTDNCDMDLWVTDPYGEKCFYSHTLTEIGGRISADCTGGYGPEEFMLKTAARGKYTVQINYYGSRAQTITGPTTVQVKMITNYGQPNEKTTEVTRRLASEAEVIDIGSFAVE